MLQEASGAAGHPSYRRYHYGTGPLLVEDGGTRRFISTDALGSTTDLTTTGATVASMRKYDAWGQYRNDTAPQASEPKLGFTGHQYDPETGLVYARARYYDPEMGRFISRDTYEGALDDAPSLHRYAYAFGNPLGYVDLDGNAAADAAEEWEQWQRKKAYTGEEVMGGDVRRNSERILSWGAAGGFWRGLAAVAGATANDIVGGIAATVVDPGMLVRGVMRLGAAAGEGTVDIQEGRYLEGAGKIAGDVGGLILTAEGGYRAATAPMRAAASEARIQYARERIVETVREASGEGTPGAVVRVPEPPLGGPPAAVPSAPGARVVELHPEVMEALQLAKAEQAAASPAIAGRLAERAANDPAALVAMDQGAANPTLPDVVRYKPRPELSPWEGSRQAGIARAWRQEADLVRETGRGTRPWTSGEATELLTTGEVEGYTGHHINNVAQFPEWAGDPRNIRFLGTEPEGGPHLRSPQGHRGSYQTPTRGRLIDRKATARARGG